MLPAAAVSRITIALVSYVNLQEAASTLFQLQRDVRPFPPGTVAATAVLCG